MILYQVLALDLLYSFLTPYERHLCHLNILDKSTKLTDKIGKAIKLIEDNQWKQPPCSYHQDRVLYYTVEGKEIPANEYKDPIEKKVLWILK